jgi:hypothetical protein
VLVKLPGPVEKKENQPVPWSRPNAPPPPVNIYYYQGRNGSYLVSAYVVPPRPDRPGEDRLLEASQAIRESFKIPPDGPWQVNPLAPIPNVRPAGLEVSWYMKTQDQHVTTHLYLLDNILYNLTAVGTDTWMNSSETSQFLNSLEVKHPLTETGAK